MNRVLLTLCAMVLLMALNGAAVQGLFWLMSLPSDLLFLAGLVGLMILLLVDIRVLRGLFGWARKGVK